MAAAMAAAWASLLRPLKMRRWAIVALIVLTLVEFYPLLDSDPASHLGCKYASIILLA
jgi:hypothetical protein